MSITKWIQASLVVVTLASPAYSSPQVRHLPSTSKTVTYAIDDPAPPPPPRPGQHVRLVETHHPQKRHHGLRGAVERLHRHHLRMRARLYNKLFNH